MPKRSNRIVVWHLADGTGTSGCAQVHGGGKGAEALQQKTVESMSGRKDSTSDGVVSTDVQTGSVACAAPYTRQDLRSRYKGRTKQGPLLRVTATCVRLARTTRDDPPLWHPRFVIHIYASGAPPRGLNHLVRRCAPLKTRGICVGY